ncbi:ATP-binding protein [Streptomyces oceani]|uniref:Histidine kinase/HSP90-like ATPase domain-containing protein n=1 Tax=Streptomyces oceani TaxID=1075402 RepID=A0A1E7KLU1_9ACTN|nr:ATP-binding protein [Streptomyces oceani]OEV04781.1 hypothetical protein AN216_05780 [Streptomyces oceani]
MSLRAVPAPAPPSSSVQGWQYSLRLPHHARAPQVGRATVRTVLRAHELHEPTELVDSAELLCSELVTNAYRYAAGEMFLRLRWEPRAAVLRLSVRDMSPEPPTPAGADPYDTSGRGLFLIRRLAIRWGVYDFARTGGGKVVWAELSSPLRPDDTAN